MQNLRAEIERRYGTVHQFCKRHPTLNRATVYMLLAGTYGGNRERQAKRIKAALSGEDGERQVFEAIKRTACARCHVKGRCQRCDDLFTAQARAAMGVFSS
jgi:hypothetical protein